MTTPSLISTNCTTFLFLIRGYRLVQSASDNVKHVLSKKYTSLEEVFNFLTQNHSFYTAEKLVERANRIVSPKDLKGMNMLQRSYGGKEGERNYSNYVNSESSSFAFGTIFGIALVIVFRTLAKRGVKNHST